MRGFLTVGIVSCCLWKSDFGEVRYDEPSWEQSCRTGAKEAYPSKGTPVAEAQDGKEYQQGQSCSGYDPRIDERVNFRWGSPASG